MSDEITLTIDDQTVTVPTGTTILQAARSVDIQIPTICLHQATTSLGICRTCVVEVQGWRMLAASCVTQAAPGMVVNTHSERVVRSRRTILEMLNSTVDLSDAPEILDMIKNDSADLERFPGAERKPIPLLDDNPMYIRDYSKCLLCWRCVQVCAEDAQYTFAINFDGRGFETQIGTFFDRTIPETSCVLCGQCVAVCPTGALKPKREYLLEQGMTPDQISVMNTGRKQRKLKS